MHLRTHLAHHDAIDQLPLLTESARITDVTAMDTDRTEEVVAAIAALLGAHGESDVAERVASGGNDTETLDLTTVTELLEKDVEDSTLARSLRVLFGRYDRPYPSLLRIRLETDTEVEFVPGQYVGINYHRVPRAYSLTSVPHQPELELCVRRVPGGRLTSQLSTELDVGDPVTVRGPYGDLALEEKSDRDLVFLATGTGVAPFKSMIDYTFQAGWDIHEGERRDVWLFLGAAWEDDLPYREESRALADEHPNFHFVPTLSRERYLSDWDGETSYVQNTLLKYLDEDAVTSGSLGAEQEQYLTAAPRSDIDARLDPARMEVYACGINAMVYSLVDTIERIGVPERHIQLEGYG